MSVEEPPYLVVGTDVSAKYRGAFCEAKVKKIVKLVKIKATIKETNTSILVTDEDIKGPLKVGMRVEAKHPDTNQMVDVTINKIMDSSTYTVVFDDGDENTLRRTQLCLKGDRHFVKSETLDQLPLTHPEHFGTPVMKTGKGYKRRRGLGGGASDSESEIESSDDCSPKKTHYKGRMQELVGRVLLMEFEDRKKTAWVPVLVVNPDASDHPLRNKDHLLVKSFKDNKFNTVTKKETKDFTRDVAVKNEDKTLKTTFERALSYFDSRELPSNWDREELLGTDSEDEDQSDSSDDEPNEEKDRFVAQLYKFMDDRGTPINKAPVINNHDLNLYRLFRVVQNIGGYNKVTNQMKWRMVFSKMNLPPAPNSANQIKTAYKKYCGAFEDFYRKLGSTMGTISRPGRSRHSSGRSLLSFREREKESPRSPKSEKKVKEERKEEKEEDKSKTPKEAEKNKSKESDKVTTKNEKASDERDDLELESPRKSRSRTHEQKRTPVKEDPVKEKEPDLAKPVTREDMARQAREEASKATQVKIIPKVAQVKHEESRKPNKPETRKAAKDEDMKIVKDDKKVEEKKGKEERGKEPEKKGSKEEDKKGKEDEKKTCKDIEKRVGKEVKVIKEDKSTDKVEKSEAPEEDKAIKKFTRKKSPRVEKEEKEEDKTEKKKPAQDDKESISEASAEHSEEDEETVKPRRESKRRILEDEYGVGTKLKVKYGRGRNQKLYEAKVVEAEVEHGSMHYLVHYAGWNNRYDEWVQKDRIIGRVDAATNKGNKSKIKLMSPKSNCKPVLPPPFFLKKRIRPPGSIPSKPALEPRIRLSKPVGIPSTSTKPPRPTRSNSTDVVKHVELPRKRRSRRGSGFTETSDAQSHVSDSDSEGSDEDKDHMEDEPLDTKSEMSLDDQDSKSVDSMDQRASIASVEDHSEAHSEAESENRGRTRTSKFEIKPRTRKRTWNEQNELDSVDDQSEVKPEIDTVEADHLVRGKEKIIVNEVVRPVIEAKISPPLTAPKLDKIEPVIEIQEDSKFSAKTKTEHPPPVLAMKMEIGEVDSDKKESVEDSIKVKGKRKEVPVKPKQKLVNELPVSDSPIKAAVVEEKQNLKEDKSEGPKDPAAVYDFEFEEEPASHCRKELKRKEPLMEEVKTKMKVKSDKDEVLKSPEKVDKTKPKDKEKVKSKTPKSEKKVEKLETKQDADTEKEKKTETEKKKTKKKVKKKLDGMEGENIKSDVFEKDIKPLVPEVELVQPTVEVKPKETENVDSVKPESEITVPLVSLSAAEDDSKPPVLSCSSPLHTPAPLSPQTVKLDNLNLPGEFEELGSPPALPTLVPETFLAPSVSGADKPAELPTTSGLGTVSEEPTPIELSTVNLSLLPPPILSSVPSAFDNTPPDTPENSPPSAPPGGHSPHSQEDRLSLRSADDASLEDEGIGDSSLSHPMGAESPNACDTSTLSNGSGGSSGNAPSSEGSIDGALGSKRKSADGVEECVPVKRRKRGHKRATPVQSEKHRHNSGKSHSLHMSDSDEATQADVVSALINALPNAGHHIPIKRGRPCTPPSACLPIATTSVVEPPRPPRPPKYNFNLEEGQYLEGEKRITFLQDKITEIRRIYMSLKAEVACIDRRRKRHKRKEKEAQQASSSQVEVECS